MAALAWGLLSPLIRVFHGKPEHVWMAGLANIHGVADGKEWQDFGAEGIPILVKGLGKRNGPLDGVYSALWAKLPKRLKSRLPKPVDSRWIRIGASFALLSMGNDARTAAPALCRALDDRDRLVQINAIQCLNGLLPAMTEPEKTNVLPAFQKAMKSKDMVMRYQVAIAMGYYQEQARSAVPVLVNYLGDPDINVRHQVLSSLNQIKIEPAAATWMVPFCIKCLSNQEPAIRAYAATKLGILGSQPDIVVPALIEALGDKDLVTAFRAAGALGQFGERAHDAIPALLKARESQVPLVHKGAVNALKLIDPAGAYSLNKP
ncbi:MAG: lyase domain protein repeat-containing protein [Pedosphaera sp.]|nr:lyase domain protein repeat-containing protein [Pedosphaera sp.]